MAFNTLATEAKQVQILNNQNTIKSKQSTLLSNQNSILSKSAINANKKVIGEKNTIENSLHTAHYYTGSGILRSSWQFYKPFSSSDYQNSSTLKITIDNVVIAAITGGRAGASGSTNTNLTDINVRFENHLKIEHSGPGSGYAKTFWNYDKD